jgi:hypothetical protein
VVSSVDATNAAKTTRVRGRSTGRTSRGLAQRTIAPVTATAPASNMSVPVRTVASEAAARKAS